MSSRTIEAPGIELKEIDRSQYQKPDYSLPNAPISLIAGFASKGEDYTLQWINTKATLDETFGTPTNEVETWFYNAVCEILNRGGAPIAAKLPYDNASLQKYTYRDWDLSPTVSSLCDGATDPVKIEYIREIYYQLVDVLKYLDEEYDGPDVATLASMWEKISELAKLQLVNDFFDGVIVSPDLIKFNNINKEEGAAPEEKECTKSVRGCAEALELVVLAIKTQNPYSILMMNDSELTSYIELSDAGSGVADLETLDQHLTYSKSLLRNRVRIYDITRKQYGAYDKYDCVRSHVQNDESDVPVWTNDCLGVVPVLVTAANALYFQSMVETYPNFNDRSYASKIPDVKYFNTVSSFGTIESGKCGTSSITDLVSTYFDPVNLSGEWLTIPLSSPPPTANDLNGSTLDFEESVAKDAVDFFPAMNWRDQKHYEKDYMKHIGVVVFEVFKDTANDSRLSFKPLEAFVGSLDRTAKDPLTGASTFIDNVVNSRSKCIRLFSNADKANLDRASILLIKNQRATSLGFHDVQCRKTATLQTSILDALTKILDQCKDPNTVPLDLVVDAGVSNIAQLIESSGVGEKKMVDFDVYQRIADFGTYNGELLCRCGCGHSASSAVRAWSLNSVADTYKWRAVLKKFDDFAKYTRKDCLFLADGLRTFCLEGDEKLVRKTNPGSSVTATILPRVKFIADALNSSYSAGWNDWFYMADAHTGDFFWCPPSVKAASICTYCDTYFHTWEAPAGMTRGIVPNVVDVAFSPTNSEAGKMYNHQWNYAISYPLEGIVMEGQKTFQTDRTALDRINVRRLLLDLEKKTIRVARHFLYEGNTEWLRQQFVDQIKPIFEDAVAGNGILDYAIKCDNEINTEQTIENHELHCKIGIKPVKCLEYLVLTFICTRQGANVQEEVLH